LIEPIDERSRSATANVPATCRKNQKEFSREVPDVVLLDLSMPGLDGATTMRALRSLPGGATLPVHVLGLRAFAEVVWVIAAVLLVVLIVLVGGHWLRHPTVARGHARNPQMAHFYGAAPMALMTVGGGAMLVGKDLIGERIAVGLGEFAEATAVSPSEILVNGKAPGETSLIVWEAGGGRQFFNLIVRPSTAAANDRVEALRRPPFLRPSPSPPAARYYRLPRGVCCLT